MKYHRWKTAEDCLHPRIVFQLIMSRAEETSEAVKNKNHLAPNTKPEQLISASRGINMVKRAVNELHRAAV